MLGKHQLISIPYLQLSLTQILPMMQCISSLKTYRLMEHVKNPFCFSLTEQGEYSQKNKQTKKTNLMPNRELMAKINVIIPLKKSIKCFLFPLPVSFFSLRHCANRVESTEVSKVIFYCAEKLFP